MIHDLFMRFPKGRSKAFTLSYDDGQVNDKELIEIFNKYKVKCTFNLNSQRLIEGSGNRIQANEYLKLIEGSGHEIAVHTCTHPSLATIPKASAVYQIVNDRKNLEEIFGSIVRGMAYPNGTWAVDSETVEAVKCAQIAYARTTTATHSFELPKTPLLLDPTCHHNDANVFGLIDEFLDSDVKRFSKMFYLWGHSYEFKVDNNWDRIEKILDKISGRDDIWYATNIEIIDYINAYNSLQFSVNLDMVYNPSATDLYFTHNYSEPIKIKAGETLKIG